MLLLPPWHIPGVRTSTCPPPLHMWARSKEQEGCIFLWMLMAPPNLHPQDCSSAPFITNTAFASFGGESPSPLLATFSCCVPLAWWHLTPHRCSEPKHMLLAPSAALQEWEASGLSRQGGMCEGGCSVEHKPQSIPVASHLQAAAEIHLCPHAKFPSVL